MYHHDVMTVGEPSMMGSEYGEEDERRIARVENIHYSDSSVAGNGNGGNHILMNSVTNAMGPVSAGCRQLPVG